MSYAPLVLIAAALMLASDQSKHPKEAISEPEEILLGSVDGAMLKWLDIAHGEFKKRRIDEDEKLVRGSTPDPRLSSRR